MNTTMYVNHADKTITITKAFNKMASIYGTDEFKMLHRAIQDTGYSVIVILRGKYARILKTKAR